MVRVESQIFKTALYNPHPFHPDHYPGVGLETAAFKEAAQQRYRDEEEMRGIGSEIFLNHFF